MLINVFCINEQVLASLPASAVAAESPTRAPDEEGRKSLEQTAGHEPVQVTGQKALLERSAEELERKGDVSTKRQHCVAIVSAERSGGGLPRRDAEQREELLRREHLHVSLAAAHSNFVQRRRRNVARENNRAHSHRIVIELLSQSVQAVLGAHE